MAERLTAAIRMSFRMAFIIMDLLLTTLILSLGPFPQKKCHGNQQAQDNNGTYAEKDELVLN